MNKNKEYTKMILNRLNNKPNHPIKSNSNSNQKTQSTPTQNQPSTDPKTFFEEFQVNCAVYHSPVILKTNRKPFVRPLYFELTQMQYKNGQRMHQQSTSSRMVTQPTQFSQFMAQQPRKVISRSSYMQHKDHRSCGYKKTEEKPNKSAQHNQYISRYRSLKTLPSCSSSTNYASYVSNTYTSQYGSHYPNAGISTTRRILIPQQRKDSLQMRYHKLQRRRLQPREELMKRCDSFQKFYLGRPM